MQVHDEERDIYGTVTVQGMKYFLLEPRPYREREWWMLNGMNKWLVAADNYTLENNPDAPENEEHFIAVYGAGYLIFGSNAIIELLPVPLTKKVIRFYVTDDEEA